MAKKTYGDSTNSNQTVSHDKGNKSNSNKLYEVITSLVTLAIIGSFVWFVAFENKTDDDIKTTTEQETDMRVVSSDTTEMVTESTEELTKELDDEHNPKKVGIIRSSVNPRTVHHYTYNEENDNWVNDDDPYDIFACTYAMNDSGGVTAGAEYDDEGNLINSIEFSYDENGKWYREDYNSNGYPSHYEIAGISTCSKDEFEYLKQIGFLIRDGSKYYHYSYAEKEINSYFVDRYANSDDTIVCSGWWRDDIVKSYYDSYNTDCENPDIDIDSWVYGLAGAEVDGVITYIPDGAIIAKSVYCILLSKDYDTNGFIYNDCHYSFSSDKWVNDETGESLDSIPDEVLSRTKELYKQYGFDYKGYHHSYDSNSDKWICDDNTSVSYDYESIPEDIDIVWLKESL